MTTRILVFMLCFGLQAAAHAQGTFLTNYVCVPLAISFAAESNSPVDFLPSGDGNYTSEGGLLWSGTFLSLDITATVPTNTDPFTLFVNATIEQVGSDGTLTPILFSGGSPAFNQSLIAIGTPSSVRFSTSSIALTPNSGQDLLDGKWFVEADFSYGSYIGQISAVPEPSSIGLVCFAAAFFVLFWPKIFPKRPSPSKRREPTATTLTVSTMNGNVTVMIPGGVTQPWPWLSVRR